MLLALLDLARSGGLADNRILFAPPLLERYQRFFAAVRTPSDHPNPTFPSSTWPASCAGAKPVSGTCSPCRAETALAALSAARSLRDITDNIACATLDPELFALLLQQPESLEALADTLSTYWLDRGLQDLRAVAARAGEVSRYEHQLRQGAALTATEALPPAYVRDPAFRRVVIELYDYRCAASGERILLPSGEAMVEAAHIHLSARRATTTRATAWR